MSNDRHEWYNVGSKKTGPTISNLKNQGRIKWIKDKGKINGEVSLNTLTHWEYIW